MKLGRADLLEVLIEALRYEPSERELDAARRPPYPLPRRWRRPRERIVQALQEAVPPDGRDVETITRVRAPIEPYASAVEQFGRPGTFSFSDSVCLLTAGGVLTIADAHRVAALVDGFDARALHRQIVLLHLARDDVAAAEAEAERMGPEWAWTAHRSIGRHLARRGDTEAFFARWSTYRAVKDRNEMDRLKGELVEAVGARDGWQRAVELTKDRRLGSAYAEHAFVAPSENGDVEGLLELFGGPARGVLGEIRELKLLAAALVAAAGPAPPADHPRLGEVLDRVIALDPTADKETMRDRDGILLQLWPAYGEESTLRRARAAARAPWIKRELSALPRDVPGPDAAARG
jgi:hypothetical protein